MTHRVNSSAEQSHLGVKTPSIPYLRVHITEAIGRHQRPRPQPGRPLRPAPSTRALAPLSSPAACSTDARWRLAVRMPKSPAPSGHAHACRRGATRSLQERREREGWGASATLSGGVSSPATFVAVSSQNQLFLDSNFSLLYLDVEHLLEQVTLWILVLTFLIAAEAAIIRAQACGMVLEGASAVLGTDVTMNPGASLSPFTAVPFAPPVPGPQHWPPREQHPPPPMTPSFPPGSTLLLPAFPTTPLLAHGGHGPSAPGACNVIFQVSSEGRPVEPPQTQTFVLTQAPFNWRIPGALSGSAVCPASIFLASPAMETIVTAPDVGVTQAGMGGWTPSFLPRAPPPAAQLVPIIPPANSGPRPQGTSREGNLATNQSKAAQDDSCNPKSVCENFRRWQRFKPLARRHLPQSPDAEALSCFLIPVLRSLAHLKPTMALEEREQLAVQEWQRTSNFDRMIYYEMAEKFMEFEAEEEMQIQKLQWLQGVQGLPPPAPLKLDPRGPPVPNVGLQPGTHIPTGVDGKACAPRKASRRAQPTRPKPHRSQRPLGPKAPEEIPPGAVREYVDIMEVLVGPVHSATGESDAECGEDGSELKQEEDGTYPDPDLLSYIDQLCSQEDFITKVEVVIHPRFLEELLSPEAQLDLLALAEELEQEEGLTLEELVQKRLLALKEDKGARAPPSHSAPRMDSSHSESSAGQGAQRHDRGPQLGVCDDACPPEMDFKALHRLSQTDTGLSRPKGFVPSPRHQELPPFRAAWPSPPQGQRRPGPRLGPRDTSVLRGASPVEEARGPRDRSSEDEGDLPSLAFLLASEHNLLPRGLCLSPAPASGLVGPGGWGTQRAPQGPSPQGTGLSPAPPAAAKSRKRAPCGGPAAGEKLPVPGADLGVSGRPDLALGLDRPTQPRKRRCDPFASGGRRKRHCSQ
ncbi:NUT family member 2G-like [Hippopotamus amphibius kiboko]|uniref:NUT family member 2G-like n=1 Tax=Hippopotamus amphibius kiboko TaxID=575201 RepID=UPI002598319B|nr:NUT family member 2G-like [Hippopotamus amphibius kiboko]